MDPSFSTAYGLLFWIFALGLALVWPFLIVWLLYRFTHDLRRIASALERIDYRLVSVSPAAAPPRIREDAPGDAVVRPIVNSMFGR
jgi:hypothetical protein